MAIRLSLGVCCTYVKGSFIFPFFFRVVIFASKVLCSFSIQLHLCSRDCTFRMTPDLSVLRLFALWVDMEEYMFFTLPPFLIFFQFLQFNWWSRPPVRFLMQFQAYKQNYTTIGKKIAQKEMPAEQDKTILALGPGFLTRVFLVICPERKQKKAMSFSI